MYIGKSPQTGAYSILDSLTASATASYTMQLGGVNYTPESAQHLILSLNGTIQKPNSSFTCSGSTLTFSEALTSSDSIDFIYALGNVLDIGTPSDATVTNAKTNFVSTSSTAGLQIKGDNTTAGTLQLNCEQNSHGIKLKSPPHSASASYTLTFPNDDGTSGQALTTNGSGVLTWADAGGTNTPSFLAVLSGNQAISNATDTIAQFNSETFDTHNAYDNSSSYKFTPQTSGKYFIFSQIRLDTGANNNNINYCFVELLKNGSSVNSSILDFRDDRDGRKMTIYTATFVDMNGSSDYVQARGGISANVTGDLRFAGSSNTDLSYFGGYKIIE